MSLKRTVRRTPKNHDHNRDAQIISSTLLKIEKPKLIKNPKRLIIVKASSVEMCKPRLTKTERLKAAKKRRRSHRKTRHVTA